MIKELCFPCGQETPYDINYPVDQRLHYIDGSGQLCVNRAGRNCGHMPQMLKNICDTHKIMCKMIDLVGAR